MAKKWFSFQGPPSSQLTLYVHIDRHHISFFFLQNSKCISTCVNFCAATQWFSSVRCDDVHSDAAREGFGSLTVVVGDGDIFLSSSRVSVQAERGCREPAAF